jgi:putative flippase GtrA
MKSLKKNNLIKKFTKYFIVGIIGTVTHLSVLIVLVEFFKYNYILGSTIGFVLTVVISYYLNYIWTFRSREKHTKSLPRYIIVSIIGLCLNTCIMFLAVNVFGLWYLIGQAITVLIIPVTNFILNSYWSFKL